MSLFKTVEALRGAFFFSTSVKLNTKGAGGGGVGYEMMGSNTYLPSILTPGHFWADRIWPALAFQSGFLYKAVVERLTLPPL